MTSEAEIKQRLNAAQRHSLNCAKQAPPVKPWLYKDKRIKDVRLFQAENGEWRLRINGNAADMQATDVEVWLWLRLCALEGTR